MYYIPATYPHLVYFSEPPVFLRVATHPPHRFRLKLVLGRCILIQYLFVPLSFSQPVVLV